MGLLGAFQCLLHYYTGQDDFAIGSPVAGRTRTEVEDLIGLFVNTLVLRADLAGDVSFRTILRRTRSTTLDALAHQDLPFDQLVSALHPNRQSGRSPLFRVMFVLQNAPLPALKSPDLVVCPIEQANRTAKFDLTLSATETDGSLVATFEHDADLFESATIDRMLSHFRTLLESIVADPDAPIGTLPILTEVERHQLIHGWNIGRSDIDISSLSDKELDLMLDRFSAETRPDGQTAYKEVGELPLW
jgi:non-ribosomal peptide synthetase component F